jgi:hypothetical protein
MVQLCQLIDLGSLDLCSLLAIRVLTLLFAFRFIRASTSVFGCGLTGHCLACISCTEYGFASGTSCSAPSSGHEGSAAPRVPQISPEQVILECPGHALTPLQQFLAKSSSLKPSSDNMSCSSSCNRYAAVAECGLCSGSFDDVLYGYPGMHAPSAPRVGMYLRSEVLHNCVFLHVLTKMTKCVAFHVPVKACNCCQWT